jgi:hypothetical protein
MTTTVVYQRSYFADLNGKPLDDGALYIGTANQDPQTNPIQCYWDTALSVPATQPLAISAGYVVNNGIRSAIYVAPDSFSLRARNRAGVQVDYIASANDISLRTDLTGSGGSSLVGFLQAGAGAVVRTVQSKLRECVSVFDFGATGNGATDDTAAIQAAITAVGVAGGGIVLFPRGTFKVASTLLVAYANVTLAGVGVDATTITSTSTTADIIQFYNASAFTGGGVRNLAINSSNTATAGAHVHVNGQSRVLIENVWSRNPFTTILLDGNHRACRVKDVDVTDHRGDAVIVNGGGNPYFDNLTTYKNGAAGTAIAIKVIQVEGIWLTRCVTQLANKSLVVIPGSGQSVLDMWINDCDFDAAASDAVVFDTTGGGSIITVNWNGSRIGFSGGRGLVIMGANGLSFQFDNLRSEKNVGHGVEISGGKNLTFDNAQILGNAATGATNTYGALISGGDGISFTGGRNGPYEPVLNNQLYAFVFTSGFTGVATLNGMDLRGNVTGPILDGATTAKINVSLCPGFNPGGLGIITVGASPFVYAAGRSRETVMIRGGTVSNVQITDTVGTLAVFQASPCTVVLEPGQTCTVTYSSLPTITKSVA